jgi:tetratricopeptide (TPR) repeat protein
MAFIRAVLLWGLTGFAGYCSAAPYRPVDPNLELAHGLSPYRASLTVAAPTLAVAITEAQSLIVEGRRRADVRAFSYAEKLLVPFAGQIKTNAELSLLSADIHQYRHDFTGAVQILDDLVHREPQNASARLMRAEIRLAQGRGRDALQDCLSLVGRESPWIWSACAAQAYAISGRLAAAKQLLSATLRDAAIEGERGAWAAGIMADLNAQSGEPAEAETWLRRALAANPDDHVAAIQLLDQWILSGRTQQALEWLRDRPVSDAYLIRKAQALAALDPAQSRLVVTDLERRFADADALGDRTHLRERALFELLFGDPKAALAHARENFQTQRELVDARLVLQAAASLHDKGGAAQVVAWLRDTHAEDARLTPELELLGVIL